MPTRWRRGRAGWPRPRSASRSFGIRRPVCLASRMDDMNQAPLRVALAGAGMISWHHLLAWKKLEPGVRLVAVCDPDTTRARKRAEEFGIPQVFASAEDLFANQDIDVLDVASPRETHA